MTGYIEPSDVDIHASPETVQAYISDLEADRDELEFLLNEGIATDADTRQQARNDALREAAKICNENRDVSGWVSRDAILALIDTPTPAPAQPSVPSKGRVTVPEGQTPLDDKLGHPLLDAFNEGIAARDSGECSPYHGHSLEHCIHAAGWVQRDLRLALDKAQPSVQELAFLVLMREGMARGEKAMRKFPQPNYVITKFAEEAGEVVKALVHHAEDRETRENVLDEIRDTIGMLWRLWIEGDEVHGLRALAGEREI